MPIARGIRAGRAFVELFADDSKLVRGLRRAEKKLHGLGLKIAGLGGGAESPRLRVKDNCGAQSSWILIGLLAPQLAGDRRLKNGSIRCQQERFL